jgi:hypothetical protein
MADFLRDIRLRGNAAGMSRQSSSQFVLRRGLSRASTSLKQRGTNQVDGRHKSGLDEET